MSGKDSGVNLPAVEKLLIAVGVDDKIAGSVARLIGSESGGALDAEALEAKVSWRVLRWNLAFFMPPLLAVIGLVGWLLNRVPAWCAG
jgi:hypothetical protein